jgi:uncharacterized protein YndB with AHSA1/START domain
MTEEHAGAWTRKSRVIRARPEELYAAFPDPAALVDWLPPAEMTGDPRIRRAGRRRLSDVALLPAERAFRGKTSHREDMVKVRFAELTPLRRIVDAGSFVTTDPAFFGEMTMTATFAEVPGGTEVTPIFENLPPGLRTEDNETGSCLGLEQPARRFEG